MSETQIFRGIPVQQEYQLEQLVIEQEYQHGQPMVNPVNYRSIGFYKHEIRLQYKVLLYERKANKSRITEFRRTKN